MKTPEEIVQIMMNKDAFSQWLNVEIVELGLGYSKLKSVLHHDMLNGFEIVHGGITYSLSDTALAFAANSYGFKCVSIETSISHIRPAYLGDTLFIRGEEVHKGKSFAIYSVTITNQKDELISKFKGTVNISSQTW